MISAREVESAPFRFFPYMNVKSLCSLESGASVQPTVADAEPGTVDKSPNDMRHCLGYPKLPAEPTSSAPSQLLVRRSLTFRPLRSLR